MFKYLAAAALLTLATAASTTPPCTTVAEAYAGIQQDFAGHPARPDAQRAVETVLIRYRTPVVGKNVCSLAAQLTDYRQRSKRGVTEMRLLRFLAEEGDSTLPISQELARGYNTLELL
jgi:hypothetical protein